MENDTNNTCKNCGEDKGKNRLFCDKCKNNWPGLEDIEEIHLENEIL